MWLAGGQVEKAPLESYADVGGLDQQIQEIKEAVELPLTHPELYEDIGIKPPKAGPVAAWGSCLQVASDMGCGTAGLPLPHNIAAEATCLSLTPHLRPVCTGMRRGAYAGIIALC